MFLAVKVNESCFFNEQCEKLNYQTECKEGVCSCRYEMQAVVKSNGQIECVAGMYLKRSFHLFPLAYVQVCHKIFGNPSLQPNADPEF